VAPSGEVCLWDVATGQLMRNLHGHQRWLECVAFDREGAILYTGGGTHDSPGEVRLWNGKRGGGWVVPNAHGANISCAAWSSDGALLATGSNDRSIKLWDGATGKLQGVLTGHEGVVRSLAFSLDNKKLLSGGDDQTARLWDLEANREIRVLTRHRQGVKAVAFSPDGKWLAVGASHEGQAREPGGVQLFDAKTLQERSPADWSQRPALTLAFSPDSRTLVTGLPGSPSLFVYDVATGRLLRSVTGSSSIRYLAYRPDGKMLATGHGRGGTRGDGSIQLREVTRWAEDSFLQGHASLCLFVSFTPDGKTLASASTDGTAKLWDLTSP
jgi:WD40 repeat protein